MKSEDLYYKESLDLDKFIESNRAFYGEGVSIKDVAMGILGGVLCSFFTFGLLALVIWGI